MIPSRILGQTGLKVPVISFGGASISGEGGGYGFGSISESEALALLVRAFEKGITLFDTAPVYGFGLSEKRIGRAFSKTRERVLIASKAGVTWSQNRRIYLDCSPAVVEKMLEMSLTNLNTDYIDIYMIHSPDPKVDIRVTMQVLAKAKREKKIRYTGLCNVASDDVNKASEVESVDLVQNELNLFNAGAVKEVFPAVEEKNIGFMSWGTLDKGILTGSVTGERAFEKKDVRSWAPWLKKQYKEPRIKAMDKMLPLINRHGYSGLELALGFVLQHRQVSTALCGMRNFYQLDTCLSALDHLPPKDLIQQCMKLAKSK